MNDKCENCRYFMHAPALPAPLGLCRRYPPQLILIGMSQPTIVTPNGPPVPQPITQSTFPTVIREGWCGEYLRAETLQ